MIPPTNMKIIHLKHLKQVFQFVEPPTNTLLRNPLKFETPRAFHHYPSSKTCSQVTKTQQDRDTWGTEKIAEGLNMKPVLPKTGFFDNLSQIALATPFHLEPFTNN